MAEQTETRKESRQKPYPIVLANEVEHLHTLSELLNAYRVANGKANDPPAVAHYLFERLINHEALIFLALKDETETRPEGLGFLSLYPTFSAQSLMPVWMLGELYVTAQSRRQGIARALITQALTFIQQRGDEGVVLDIAQSNTAARQLFEQLGFRQETAVNRYSYALSDTSL